MKRGRARSVVSLLALFAVLAGFVVPGPAAGAPVTTPGSLPDYYTTPNWAFSPPLTKFVDALPGLAFGNPDIVTYPGSDYYEIRLEQYQQKMHTELDPTTLRGYVQTNYGTALSAGTTPEQNQCGADNHPCTLADNTVAPAAISYLGPTILAKKDRPVRVLFTNGLAANAAGGKLFVPVDTSIMGSGPYDVNYDPVTKALLNGGADHRVGDFTENRATLHLHGGRTPWISDGTPHQWITPSGDPDAVDYPQGISVSNVPDMPDPGAGSQTFYWTNQQSARLMFYHDHAWGLTRLNVYVGEAAGYLITDDAEQSLMAAGQPLEAVGYGVPLVIQDKTFVDPATIVATDPTWAWGSSPWNGTPGAAMTPVLGDLWWPHVYMPAQDPYNPDFSGINAMGRWHYGPWFWPPTPLCGSSPQAVLPWCIEQGTLPNPYYDCYLAGEPDLNNPPDGVYAADGPCINYGQAPEIPGTPSVSWGAEAFLDTPIVNGMAYPTYTVDPKQYRFRILNAAHDRFLNLQLYVAASKLGPTTPGAGAPVFEDTVANLTEVAMVQAAETPGYPALWPVDAREGGVPDPATSGPAFVQIGTEGGFLPTPAILNNQPIQWNGDPTMFNVGNVLSQSEGGGTLILGPAERADVLVDFSNFAGKTLILYNDAPAAFPALDPHYDFYTGAPDRTGMGGAPAVAAGFGPNIRTIMQIVVGPGASSSAPANDFNYTTWDALRFAFMSAAVGGGGVFESAQDPMVVGQRNYGTGGIAAYDRNFPSTWPYWGVSRITDTVLRFETTAGVRTAVTMKPKSIHDEMGGSFDGFGRMSAKLGLEVPSSTAAIATFALQYYVDPPTEFIDPAVDPGGVQIWKITHNGVDTHPIHFHLFDVQLVNRVGWDGFIRLPDPNELGWKDTVRISPLEDTIVALRPIAPRVPFGVPRSDRPLNPSIPIGSMMGFSNIDPLTGGRLADATENAFVDFGWEYVWHCHILSHEENDMMRSIVYNFVTTAPTAPVLGAVLATPTRADLSWTDATPPASSLGEADNEIGYRIERRTGAGAFAFRAYALANATSYRDTVDAGTTNSYRIYAYNASGDSPVSNIVSLPDLTITTNAFVNANKGVYYSRSVAVTGGYPPYAWAVSSGALPAGMSINPTTGIISGAPTTVEVANFTIQVTDAATLSVSKAFTLSVVNGPLAFVTTSFMNAQIGVYYGRSVTVAGGVTPYAWALAGGALPTGLSLNPSTGVISGTPGAAGTFTFDMQVTDSAPSTPAVISRSYSITVTPKLLAITTAAFSNANRGVAYSRSVAVTGGTSPYTWGVLSGALPTGLTLNTSTGIISGTPTVAATFTFTIQVSDSALPTAATVNKSFSLTVVNGPLTIVTNTFSNATVGTYYGRSVATTGGTTPYTWAVIGGALPPGITLLTGSGILTGTPTLAGPYSFTIQVTDSTLPTAVVVSKAFTLTVNP